jgi:hypothetical protein
MEQIVTQYSPLQGMPPTTPRVTEHLLASRLRHLQSEVEKPFLTNPANSMLLRRTIVTYQWNRSTEQKRQVVDQVQAHYISRISIGGCGPQATYLQQEMMHSTKRKRSLIFRLKRKT